MDTNKASRRKQMKPNRMPFGVDPPSAAFSTAIPPYSRQPLDEGLSRDGEVERSEGGEDGDRPLNMSVLNCRVCPDSFSTGGELKEHMEYTHGSVPARSPQDSDFPTAYHRLGSELLQENSLLPNGQAEEQEQALSLTKPRAPSDTRDIELDLARDTMGEGRSVKVNGGKIFHLDAYCELCDREFCNKYFLKTHKANKHGIYDDNSPSTPVPPDFPLRSDDGHFPPPPRKVELSPSPWQQQQQQLKKDSAVERQQGAGSVRKSETDLATEEKVSSVISAVKNSMQNSSAEGKSASSSGSASGSTPKEPSMEDYCEICQKHFCNKYYLKKHKQDVHGIIPETGPTPTKRSRANSSLLDLPMSTGSMGSPMMLPQSMASLGGMPPGVMVLNPFMPQMTLIPAGSMPPPLLHAHQMHPPPHSPVMSQPLSLSGGRPSVSPTTITPHASEVSANPDTYCSLCRKEFSNSYFLKIHKANRHGLESEDIATEAKMLGDMVENNGVVVHMPSPSRDMKQDVANRCSPPPLTSISQTVTCRQCDKDFPSVQAFKVHQITEHGKIQEAALPDSHESSLPKAEPAISEALRHMDGDTASMGGGQSGRGNSNNMLGTIVAAKLADRVVCDICNKDLCNKYFLKSHKLKMHGIDVDKEEGRVSKSGERSPPQSHMLASSKSQPLNMTLNSSQGPPPLVMPKLELNDFPDYSKDFKLGEKSGGYKAFHDVPTLLTETINNEYLRRSHTQPPFKGFDFGMPGFPAAATGSQLLEEGIDPEVYCEICKKEFCSKYFLRTHKENIHGIKADISPTERSRSKVGPKPSGPKMNSGSAHPMSGLPMPGMPFPFPPGFMMGTSSGGGNSRFNRGRDNFEKHHFRWKDPPTTNATARVTCEICNKEVCNKYFLRTHKLKKHGISPTETTASPMSGSPAPESEAANTASSQPDNFLVDKGTAMVPRSESVSVPQTIPLPPSEGAAKQGELSRNPKSEEDKAGVQNKHSNGSRDTESVRCHLCERKFRDLQWLSAHLMKDHAEVYTPELMNMRMLPPSFGQFAGELEPKRCQVCHVLLPNEISLQLHLLQEHNAQIKLQVDDDPRQTGHLHSMGFAKTVGLRPARSWKSRSGKYAAKKLKMFVCSFGDFRTHWLYKLQAHEEEVHGVSSKRGKKSSTHVSSVEENAASDLKQFKCGLCPSHFSSHTHCQTHLREAHIHMLKDFVCRKRQRSSRQRLSCKYCSFTTSFPFRLQSHVSCYHQPLSLPTTHTNTFPHLATVLGSETPPESLHSSPDHSPKADPVFDSPPQQLGKHAYLVPPSDPQDAIKLTDKLVSAGGPTAARAHEPVSASFSMAEMAP